MWCCMFQNLFSYYAVCAYRVHFNLSYIVMSPAMLVTCSLDVIFVCSSLFSVTGRYEALLGWQWIAIQFGVLHRSSSRLMFGSSVVILKLIAECP